MSEELILVDLSDAPVGTSDKLSVHRNCLLHRAFSVFLLDGDRMLLQRRAEGKYHSGGLWANSCCSHPRAGEELEEAVHRRLKQELGTDCDDVKELFSFVYLEQFPDGLCEYEYDHVFVGHCSGPFSPDVGEIAELKWVSGEDLARWLTDSPREFAAWFITAAPEVLRTAFPERRP